MTNVQNTPNNETPKPAEQPAKPQVAPQQQTQGDKPATSPQQK